MVWFEISVNGERRFVGDDVKAITIVSDRAARRDAERVSVHVGVGTPGDRQVQYLGSDLGPGDEIAIRVLADDQLTIEQGLAPEACSFCGTGVHSIQSLVAGPQAGICDSCITALDGVVTHSAALPVGASIQDSGDHRCGFCLKTPPEVAGLLLRNLAAICPACLRACADIMTDAEP